MREEFEKRLKADRYDRITRLVFADWLEESGLDDEASNQRRMATAEWEAADRWLTAMASDVNTTLPVLIAAGREMKRTLSCTLEADSDSGFGVQEWVDAHEGTMELFWMHWEAHTGEAVDETVRHQAQFSCCY